MRNEGSNKRRDPRSSILNPQSSTAQNPLLDALSTRHLLVAAGSVDIPNRGLNSLKISTASGSERGLLLNLRSRR